MAAPVAVAPPHYPVDCYWNLQGYCMLRYLLAQDPKEADRICRGLSTAAEDRENCKCPPERGKRSRHAC